MKRERGKGERGKGEKGKGGTGRRGKGGGGGTCKLRDSGCAENGAPGRENRAQPKCTQMSGNSLACPRTAYKSPQIACGCLRRACE